MMKAQEARGCAVVTGGARGIGRAVCEALAAQGYNVAVNHSHAGSAPAALEAGREGSPKISALRRAPFAPMCLVWKRPLP